MKTVSYKDSDGKTVLESFDSETQFRAWLESIERSVWGEHCQGLGDGSLDHLEIKIIEKEEPKM